MFKVSIAVEIWSIASRAVPVLAILGVCFPFLKGKVVAEAERVVCKVNYTPCWFVEREKYCARRPPCNAGFELSLHSGGLLTLRRPPCNAGFYWTAR